MNPSKRVSVGILASLLTATALATPTASAATAQEPCRIARTTLNLYAGADVLYCSTVPGAKVQRIANQDPSDVEGYINGSSEHQFLCWTTGETHDGGNNIYYFTYVDTLVHGYGIGWVKSSDVLTTTHPFPGMSRCGG
ncbi:hypothetical protein [Streptomyces sp. NRRL B-24720]|uniref:hypothetical protein n=1 Tax=Streptomyces sp. NRRL B-24720 TaxID=1476876 RepID=UPI0004CB2D05|nr:hypothetical protein [Streptomyces sp. NRRL B-24720]